MKPETSTLEQLCKSLQTFGSLAVTAECRDKLYRYNDALMQSLHSILQDCDCDEAVKLETFNTTMEQYTAAMKELFPLLIRGQVPKAEPDICRIVEVGVEKFNPYHDSKGRFATANGYASFTVRTKDPKKQHMADMAIAREKERAAAAEAAAKPKFTFTPAKTKKEAVAYAQSELGFTKASYGTKLDIDTINHINEQVARVQHQYPEVKGAVQVLKTTTAGCYAQIRTCADGTMSFEVGSNLYGRGMDYVRQSYDRDVNSGFHPAGTDANSIVFHEYGHVLANISAKGQLGISAKGKVANYNDQSKYITNRRSRSTEKEWLFEAAKSTGSKPSELMKNVSRYAQKNPAETFAESFAEVMCSANPRQDAVAMVKASGWYRQ